jgi:exodeoxyribonuclease III
VRVATFNINNIHKRLDNLLAWLTKAQPDVVSLQELKAEHGAFPVNALRTLGYEAVWQGKRSWNGVAILARNHAPVLTCASLPGNPRCYPTIESDRWSCGAARRCSHRLTPQGLRSP